MRNAHTILVLLLLGHALGDFYFQSKRMADEKITRRKVMLLHGAIYFACIGAPLLAGIPYSPNVLWIWLSCAGTHIVIDCMKKRNDYMTFIIDQAFHIAIIAAASLIWGQRLEAQGFVLYATPKIVDKPFVTLITALFWLIRPVGIFIGCFFSKAKTPPDKSQTSAYTKIGSKETWDFGNSLTLPDEPQKGAGRMIGYLERIIVFLLLIHGQFTAIAFVMAAKAVIRFPEISQEKKTQLAEYYLIGTLLSMTCTFAITLLLALL